MAEAQKSSRRGYVSGIPFLPTTYSESNIMVPLIVEGQKIGKGNCPITLPPCQPAAMS